MLVTWHNLRPETFTWEWMKETHDDMQKHLLGSFKWFRESSPGVLCCECFFYFFLFSSLDPSEYSDFCFLPHPLPKLPKKKKNSNNNNKKKTPGDLTYLNTLWPNFITDSLANESDATMRTHLRRLYNSEAVHEYFLFYFFLLLFPNN